MLIVTVNSGSSSVKLAAFEGTRREEPPPSALEDPISPEQALAPVRQEHHPGDADAGECLRGFLSRLDARQVGAVSHRVVHGGTIFVQPVRIAPDVEAQLRELSELAPLHNPKALVWIDAAREVCGPQVPQIAVFDTAFFAHLPRRAAEYALPAAAGTALGVRRYGFHGIAHEALWRRWCERHPQRRLGGRIITLQLGGGCSMAAIDQGRALDTTMGFSPLEGLVMATRSGDVDPAAVAYLAHKLGASPDRIVDLMNHESGLLGVSGVSGDMRELLARKGAAGQQSEAAEFAVELYCYRACKSVGALLAVLGGCEGIVFGGGVGEHMPEIRERILAPLGWAGVRIDASANQAARGEEARISAPDSPIEVEVIPVDEERALASAALRLVP